MQIFNQVPISPIPHLLPGKSQASDGNFTVYYFLLKLCYTNMIFKRVPVITHSTSKFHCGILTLSKFLKLILVHPEERSAEIRLLWRRAY